MEEKTDFTKGSIPKKLAGFMLPILGALVLQSMYSAVDLLIVGKFGTTEGISGVSTGASIMQTFTVLISSLSTGVTVLMGQYIGVGIANKIGRLLGNAVCFFIAFAAVMSVLLFTLAEPIAVLMQAPAEALALTVNYIRICGAGFVFVVFYNFISCIFRGMGNSRLPLIFVAIACVMNIIGDLVLVAGLKMNVTGAAIATVISQAASVFISLPIIKKQKLPFSIKREDMRFDTEIGHFLRIGFPLALQELLTSATFLAICAFVNKLSLEASSGYGVAQRIVSFVMLIPSSIMQSMASFVAQNVGAGNEKRARQAMKCGMLIGAAIGVPVAVLTFTKGDLISGIFSNDPAVIARSFEFLRGFAIEAVVTSILFSFMGYFNGHSLSGFVMLQGILQSFLVRLPVSYFMSIRENASLTGIGLAAPSATCFAIIICIFYYIHVNKNIKKDPEFYKTKKL